MNALSKNPNFLPLMTILVAGLGYVVDIYDLLIFGIVRVPSLKELGVSESDITRIGATVLNWQMAGLILGSLFWGVCGDKIGRARIMFWSIGVYSIFTLLSGFVQTVPQYALCRFVSGFGLAAEFGIAITLAAEVAGNLRRSYAVMFVATLGTIGFLFASYIGGALDWRTAYILGGCAGLLLMLLRYLVMESELFKTSMEKCETSKRGDFKIIFGDLVKARRYIASILLACTLPFSTQIMTVFAPEISRMVIGNADMVLTAATASFYYGAGLALGDVLWVVATERMKSRKKISMLCLLLSGICVAGILTMNGLDVQKLSYLYFVMGLLVLPPTLSMLIGTEQFGTNLRATATTSVAGISRGSSLIMVSLVMVLAPNFGLVYAIGLVAILVFGLAFLSVFYVKEGYGTDLDYQE